MIGLLEGKSTKGKKLGAPCLFALAVCYAVGLFARANAFPEHCGLLIGSSVDNPNFDIGRNLWVELHFDGVEAKFFQDAIELDLIGSDRNAVGFESSNDFWSADATVEVTFFVGIGLDVD